MEFLGLNTHILENIANLFSEKVVLIYTCTYGPREYPFSPNFTSAFYKQSFSKD